MTGLREGFAEKFGDEQASAIMAAAIEHNNDVHGRAGSDTFRWALTICIGYECFTDEGYRRYHGVTAPVEDIKAWIKAEADLGSHDGDVDFLGLVAGVYDEYLDEVSR